uniref:Uncharacterized protein n=1 Tax=Parascaris equorum TaxID=6256 RepID=A0A914R8H3_PAREQ
MLLHAFVACKNLFRQSICVAKTVLIHCRQLEIRSAVAATNILLAKRLVHRNLHTSLRLFSGSFHLPFTLQKFIIPVKKQQLEAL